MKVFPKALALMLAFAVVFSISAAKAYKSPYEEESTLALYKLGIVKGYEDGTFRTENSITRAEFVTLLVRLMSQENSPVPVCPFSDVPQNFWGFKYISISSGNNYINGYEDRTFRPNNNITYAEAVSVLVRILGYNDSISGKWPDNYINEAGYIHLTDNIKMPPDSFLTRGDSFVLIADALMIKVK